MYRCSHCGGTMSVPYDRCPHCGILLSGVRCENCHYTGSKSEFISNGHRCPKCGSRVDVSSSGGSAGSTIGCLVLIILFALGTYIVNKCQKNKEIKDNIKFSSYTDPYGGNDYKTVIIYNQEWMVENLSVTMFSDKQTIPEAKTVKEWIKFGEIGEPAWCYYESDSKNGEIYGKLYNWYAVTNTRNLCPEGWRIPTNQDWDILIEKFGEFEKAGRNLKSKKGWALPEIGDNMSGFTAVPGGSRNGDSGIFSQKDSIGQWWSKDEYNPAITSTDAFCYSLYYDNNRITNNLVRKSSGLSVRCIRYH